jgi:hypothetical protein
MAPPPPPPPPPPKPRRRRRLLDNTSQQPQQEEEEDEERNNHAQPQQDRNHFEIQSGQLRANVVKRKDRRYNYLRVDEFLFEASIIWPSSNQAQIRDQLSILINLDTLIHEVSFI